MIFSVVMCKKNVLLPRSNAAKLQTIELIQNFTQRVLTSLDSTERTVTGERARVMLHIFDILTANSQHLWSMSAYVTYVPQIAAKKLLWLAILWYRFSVVCSYSLLRKCHSLGILPRSLLQTADRRWSFERHWTSSTGECSISHAYGAVVEVGFNTSCDPLEQHVPSITCLLSTKSYNRG